MTARKPAPRRRRGGRKTGRGKPRVEHTSVPTGRAAYTETRRWLLEQHGPICAYCGVKFNARELTLDHVTPRRGQSAYDRRDNLVLACKRCNTAKADKPFLAYLFAQRRRAVNLLHYGAHLSEGIIALCRQLAGGEVPAAARKRHEPRIVYGDTDDGESPYREESPYKKH